MSVHMNIYTYEYMLRYYTMIQFMDHRNRIGDEREKNKPMGWTGEYWHAESIASTRSGYFYLPHAA